MKLYMCTFYVIQAYNFCIWLGILHSESLAWAAQHPHSSVQPAGPVLYLYAASCTDINTIPQWPLFTIMVMDEHGNGVPVGWFLSEREDITTVTAGLRAWVEALRRRVPGAAEWMPSSAVSSPATAPQRCAQLRPSRLVWSEPGPA
jgi:hypothetical protein